LKNRESLFNLKATSDSGETAAYIQNVSSQYNPFIIKRGFFSIGRNLVLKDIGLVARPISGMNREDRIIEINGKLEFTDNFKGKSGIDVKDSYVLLNGEVVNLKTKKTKELLHVFTGSYVTYLETAYFGKNEQMPVYDRKSEVNLGELIANPTCFVIHEVRNGSSLTVNQSLNLFTENQMQGLKKVMMAPIEGSGASKIFFENSMDFSTVKFAKNAATMKVPAKSQFKVQIADGKTVKVGKVLLGNNSTLELPRELVTSSSSSDVLSTAQKNLRKSMHRIDN